MEHEPRREPKRYYVEYQGERIVLGPDNTLLYLHQTEPQFDHIYVQFADTEDGEQRGHYIWRHNTETFEQMISDLLSIATSSIQPDVASDFDKNQFVERFGELPTLTAPLDENTATEPENAPELDWISPRREREIKNAVGFLLYLAQEGKL